MDAASAMSGEPVEDGEAHGDCASRRRAEPGAALPAPHPAIGVAHGLLVGSADAVPGVSGGTIALLIGIYVQLLDALATLLRAPALVRNAEGRGRIGWALRFLVPLGVGLVVAYWLVTLLLVGPTEAPGLLRRPASAPFFYAGFSGLVIATAVVVWRRIPRAEPRLVVLAVFAALAAALLVGLPHRAGEPATWTLLPGGAAAIGVMLLPGVSGSLLLVVLGQYATVSAAVHDRDLGVLAVFFAGVALGAATVVPLLRRLLVRHPRATHAALVGLMLGSLRALWPFKDQYDPKVGPMTNRWDVLSDPPSLAAVAGVLGAAVLGGIVVVALQRLERRAVAADAGEAAPPAGAAR